MQPRLVAKKAQFKNLAEDGIKIRSGHFKRKDKYNKKDKSWQREDWA